MICYPVMIFSFITSYSKQTCFLKDGGVLVDSKLKSQRIPNPSQSLQVLSAVTNVVV